MTYALKTASKVAIAPGATYKVYQFKMNFAAQPFDDTDMKEQPNDLDRLYTFYKGGIVVSGRYKISYMNTTAAPVAIAGYIGTGVFDKASAAPVAAAIKSYMAQNGAKYVICPPAASASKPATIIFPFNCRAKLGPLDKSEHGSTAVGAAATQINRVVWLYIIIESQSGNVTGNLFVESIQTTMLYDKANAIDA